MKKKIFLSIISTTLIIILWCQQALVRTQSMTCNLYTTDKNNKVNGTILYQIQGRGINLFNIFIKRPKIKINKNSIDYDHINKTLNSNHKHLKFKRISQVKFIDENSSFNNVKLIFENNKTKAYFDKFYDKSPYKIKINSKKNIKISAKISFSEIKDKKSFKTKLYYSNLIKNAVDSIQINPINISEILTVSFVPIRVDPNYKIDIIPRKLSCKIDLKKSKIKDKSKIKNKIRPYIIWNKKSKYANIEFNNSNNIHIKEFTPKQVRIIKE